MPCNGVLTKRGKHLEQRISQTTQFLFRRFSQGISVLNPRYSRNVWSCLAVILTILLFPQACRSLAGNDWPLNPETTELSDAEEIEMGRRADGYIRQQFYLETDPDINAAVNAILQRLVTVCERNNLPFTCNVIQSYSINAFSVPGGHIYVTCGLLRLAETEDEVAGIVGHEIAHASLRHASKLYREAMEILSRQENAARSASALMLLSNHLEEFEQEADSRGVLYAYKAGFNPNGLPDFLERHLGLIVNNELFHLLGFGSVSSVNSRINRLREHIPTLGKEK